MPERRRHDRQDFESEITYTLHPAIINKVYRGNTINCSQPGLCIRTSNPITVGQEITIKSKGKWSRGRVVWLRKAVEGLNVYYDAGVKIVISYEIKEVPVSDIHEPHVLRVKSDMMCLE